MVSNDSPYPKISHFTLSHVTCQWCHMSYGCCMAYIIIYMLKMPCILFRVHSNICHISIYFTYIDIFRATSFGAKLFTSTISTCHMSHVTCDMTHFTCHRSIMSHVIHYLSLETPCILFLVHSTCVTFQPVTCDMWHCLL